MNSFVYQIPTKIVFGKNTIPKIASLIPDGSKVMVAYGGGSILKNGVYDAVVSALKGKHPFETFAGIEANPDFATCMKCVDKIKETSCNFILAVGGGSVVDAVKFIAAAAEYKGDDAWEIIKTGGRIVEKAMPFGDVLTLPATGSEMNSGAVISRRSTCEKFPFMCRHTYPVFSILDPETTFSLPPVQTANGIADAMCHILEQYVTHCKFIPVQDSMCEGVMKALIAEVIGHELTAEFGIDHGKTLSVVGPALYSHPEIFASKMTKLAQFGRNVFDIKIADDFVAAKKAIAALEAFYRSMNIKTKLSEYPEIKDPQAVPRLIADRFMKRDPNFKLGEAGIIGGKQVEELLKLAI